MRVPNAYRSNLRRPALVVALTALLVAAMLAVSFSSPPPQYE